MRGLRYRTWARVLHRLNLHHTRRIGPMEDGTFLHRCEWCGLHRVETPIWLVEQRMRDALRRERATTNQPGGKHG